MKVCELIERLKLENQLDDVLIMFENREGHFFEGRHIERIEKAVTNHDTIYLRGDGKCVLHKWDNKED